MTNQSIESMLKDHAFFSGMSDEQVALIAGCGSDVSFDAGEVIFRQNEDADAFYILQSGRVGVDIRTQAKTLRIQTLEQNDVLGWSWYFPPHIWHFDAVAVEATKAIAMDARCLRGKCDDDIALGYELLQRFSKIVIARLEATRLQAVDMFGVAGRD